LKKRLLQIFKITAMQYNFKHKKALIRVDFNVPLDKNFNITDDTRIRMALPTIQHVLAQGGAAILMSHLGRPLKKLKEDGSLDVEKFTLRHLVGHLSDALGTQVHFCPETVGATASRMAAELQPGEVLLLENTRFQKEEEKGDETFSRQLAELGDVYINDAFGTAHRAHASTTIMARFFPPEARMFGFLMKSEVENANKVLHLPARPLTAITGGAKVSDKILLLERFMSLVDNIIIGGGMAYTFIKAQGGSIGNSLVEEDRLDLALELLAKAKAQGVNIYLPVDSVVADKFADDAYSMVTSSMEVPDGYMGLDIGEKARADFAAVIESSKTIIWNGPMGVFEMPSFAAGTKHIAQAVANATRNGAFSLVGGGDSVAAVNQMGLSSEVSFVSTGGGAMLEMLEGKELPGIKAITGQ
jgi:phosphoglycerate kinase